MYFEIFSSNQLFVEKFLGSIQFSQRSFFTLNLFYTGFSKIIIVNPDDNDASQG